MNELEKYILSLQHIMFSGGAAGADRLFGLYCSHKNIEYIHFSFNDHRCAEPNIIDIPQSVLNCNDIQNALKQANKTLKRKIPFIGSYVYNLLARNYYQIKYTDSVYAMTEVISPNGVSGGTAWAVQMYIDDCIKKEKNINLYVLCTKTYRTFAYNASIGQYEEVNTVPIPSGRWTGIGSRKALQRHLDAFIKRFI